MSKFAVYYGYTSISLSSRREHYKDNAEGHIYLDKSGACTITLKGASAMSQNELDHYGTIMAEALNKENEDE